MKNAISHTIVAVLDFFPNPTCCHEIAVVGLDALHSVFLQLIRNFTNCCSEIVGIALDP